MNTTSLAFKKTEKLISFTKDGFTSNFRREKFHTPIIEEALSIIQYYACLSYLNHYSSNPIRTPYFPHYKDKSLLFESRLPGTKKHVDNLKFEFTDNLVYIKGIDGHFNEVVGIDYILAILHLYPFCLLGIQYLTDCIDVVKPFNFTLPPTSSLDSFIEYQSLLSLYDYCMLSDLDIESSSDFNLSGVCIDKESSIYCNTKTDVPLLMKDLKVHKVGPAFSATKPNTPVSFYKSYFNLQDINLYAVKQPEVTVKKYGSVDFSALTEDDNWGPEGAYASAYDFVVSKTSPKATKPATVSKPKEVKKKPLELDYEYSRKIVWDD